MRRSPVGAEVPFVWAGGTEGELMSIVAVMMVGLMMRCTGMMVGRGEHAQQNDVGKGSHLNITGTKIVPDSTKPLS